MDDRPGELWPARRDTDSQPVPPAPKEACRVQPVVCGRCGWPSASVVQEGMRVLSFVCHWCGKTTVGVVDPTIRQNVIF